MQLWWLGVKAGHKEFDILVTAGRRIQLTLGTVCIVAEGFYPQKMAKTPQASILGE